jgi:protein TonB
MNSRSLLAASWEIKRPYRKNLAIGFGISGLFHIAAVTTVVLFISAPAPPIKVTVDPYPHIPPVISINPATPENVEISLPAVPPKIGIPVPVPDDQAPADVVTPTMDEISRMAPDTPIDIFEDRNIIIDTDKVTEELLPPPGAPAFYDEPPVVVNSVAPDYPDLAHRAGLEGKVWLEALIDKNGNVRDVQVVKSTNPNAGFEEAALAAAWKSTWKPAISNGLPIAVRITYSVVFKLQ